MRCHIIFERARAERCWRRAGISYLDASCAIDDLQISRSPQPCQRMHQEVGAFAETTLNVNLPRPEDRDSLSAQL